MKNEMKLTPEEKDNMISVLELVTRFNYEYLKSLSDEQLDKLYRERVESRV